MLKKKNMKNITTKKVFAVLLHSRCKPQCLRFPSSLAGQGFNPLNLNGRPYEP
jgi:hypothetical protein